MEMTRYERLINMSLEEMAENNLKPCMSYLGKPEFICSDTRCFSGTNAFERALQHEIEWLNEEDETEERRKQFQKLLDEI